MRHRYASYIDRAAAPDASRRARCAVSRCGEDPRVHVPPANTGTQLAEPLGKQGLSGEIVEKLVPMKVIQPLADIFEKHRSRGWSFFGIRGNSARLVDFVQAIRSRISHYSSLAAAPGNLDPEVISFLTRCKDSKVFITGEIPSATDHLLALQHGPAFHNDPRADPFCVWRQSL